MSQLDVSIFYSHLFTLIITFYVFSHFVVVILTNFYYNTKVRDLDVENNVIQNFENSNTEIINKILG